MQEHGLFGEKREGEADRRGDPTACLMDLRKLERGQKECVGNSELRGGVRLE